MNRTHLAERVRGMTALRSELERLARVLALVAVAFTVLASPAAAEEEPPVLTGICSFPIVHEFPKVHGLRDHGGATASPYQEFFTGQFMVRIVNVDTGESVTVNSNSAAFALDDGSWVFRGETLWFRDRTAGPVGDIQPGVWVVNGPIRVVLDGDGRAVSAEGGVIRRDICAELS